MTNPTKRRNARRLRPQDAAKEGEMPPKPRKHIPSIMAYPPGKPIEEVQREYGLDSVIKMASNENPAGPSPRAVKAMRAAAGEMHLYPDGAGYYLKRALSWKFRLPPDWIVLANGSDEITDMVSLAYVSPSENVVFSEHDFISYKLGAQMMGARFREVPLKNWRVDLRAILRAIDAKTKLVCLANPSNPVGTMFERDEFEAFLGKAPSRVLVLLDQAYYEYVAARTYPNGTHYVRRHPNLIVTRTFSKAYGLAGLRIGYGFAHPEVIRNFDRVRPPFNVSRIAQAAALAALEDKTHVRRSVEMNRKGKKTLEAAFERLGLDYVPSVTNFILVDTARPGAAVAERLMRQGVIVRPMGGYGLPRHVRVTVGLPCENRRFVASLKQALREVGPLA
jgi:histidinol-phosphate aminotransferase